MADSATEMTQLVLPQHANVHGTLLGGTVMHWVDLAAAIVANRHSRRPVVTAAFDEMAFLAPIMVGQVALLHARLTLVDRSSMEIRVDVRLGGRADGEKRRRTGTAFVTFVALDPVTRRPDAGAAARCWRRTRSAPSTRGRWSAGGCGSNDRKAHEND